MSCIQQAIIIFLSILKSNKLYNRLPFLMLFIIKNIYVLQKKKRIYEVLQEKKRDKCSQKQLARNYTIQLYMLVPNAYICIPASHSWLQITPCLFLQTL